MHEEPLKKGCLGESRPSRTRRQEKTLLGILACWWPGWTWDGEGGPGGHAARAKTS